MSPAPGDPDPTPWINLGETLSGHLAARARGLIGSGFVLLDGEGREFGHLEVWGPRGAELRTTLLEARIERISTSRYAMLSGDAEILTSTTAKTSPGIECLGTPYQTTLSLLRNKAEASPANEDATVRLAGGLTNRNYEAHFETDAPAHLPVTLFLLFRLVTLRREAYRAGPKVG